MRRHEETLRAIGDNIPIDDADGWSRRRNAASTAIAEINEDWGRACSSFADELADATTELLNCNLALLQVYDARAVNDRVYVAKISELAVTTDIDVGLIDPRGWLEEKISERVALLGSEDGALIFLIMETANQEDIGKADGNFSGDDMIASTDPAVVTALLTQAAEEAGYEWKPGELDLMVDEIVGTAWMMRASPDEEWEDIDDDIEWYERGVFKFAREELFAPAVAGLVGGLCYGAAVGTSPTTGGVSLGAAGYCGGLTAATYSAANTWAHGGDAGDVLESFTDLRTWGEGAVGGIAFQGATNLLLRAPSVAPTPFVQSGTAAVGEAGAIPIGRVPITYGHGGRHLAGTGLNQSRVESAISDQIRTSISGASASGSFWGRLTVNGVTIEFRAYALPNGTVNVGTYYVP